MINPGLFDWLTAYVATLGSWLIELTEFCLIGWLFTTLHLVPDWTNHILFDWLTAYVATFGTWLN